MDSANSREVVARQVIRALDNGVQIVDSIAKDDGEWRKRTTPARDFVRQVKEEVEEDKKEEAQVMNTKQVDSMAYSTSLEELRFAQGLKRSVDGFFQIINGEKKGINAREFFTQLAAEAEELKADEPRKN